MKKSFLLISALSIFTTIESADASVYDSGTVRFQHYSYGGAFNDHGSPTTFAAPGSIMFGNYFNLSVSGNQIIYTHLTGLTWTNSEVSLDADGLLLYNGSLLSSISGIPAITSVTINPLSQLGASGFSNANITWNSGAVAVDWVNLTFAPGDTVILDVNGGADAVPEPATWAMMLLGMGSIGFAMRRAKRARVRFAY